MKGPLGVLLLVWSMLQGTVIEPFVEQARTLLAETREDAVGLEKRWRALGVSAEVTEPVDAISDVAEVSLGIPEEMTEAYAAVVEAGRDGEDPAEAAAGALSPVMIGNHLLIAPLVADGAPDTWSPSCSTRLRISNADSWREGEWFYVTLRLLSGDGRELGRYTRRLSAVDPAPWVVDLVDVAEFSLLGPGWATVTAHHQIAEGWKAPSEDARICVEIIDPCPPDGSGAAVSE